MKKNYIKPKLTTKTSWKTIFFANSGGFSSKRVFGALLVTSALIIFVLAFALEKDVPEFGDMIIITGTSLLGIDSVSNIFQKRVNK